MGLEFKEQNDLIKGCIDGDRSAQYAFYKKYSKAMYNISYRITNDSDDAADVLQEAFLSAYKYLHSFKGESSVGAWLKRIVVNASINHIKKQRLMYEPIENHEAGEEENTLRDEDIILELERVKSAIQQLPDGFRTVFSLYLLEGYDHREIADILGISESTSKSQYNRAKKRLKEILKERVYING
ncbi:MAG: RNA polymerase sigma factor [Cyclobacteriaceae bacterium]|nr:RNA polymerase sigma factor [Cyclobacteriaceae bacterium]